MALVGSVQKESSIQHLWGMAGRQTGGRTDKAQIDRSPAPRIYQKKRRNNNQPIVTATLLPPKGAAPWIKKYLQKNDRGTFKCPLQKKGLLMVEIYRKKNLEVNFGLTLAGVDVKFSHCLYLCFVRHLNLGGTMPIFKFSATQCATMTDIKSRVRDVNDSRTYFH